MTGQMSGPAPARLVSLDQFRGYTVAGMLLVNFVGHFAATPAVLRHHNTYCSYADTIMPQFFFAVGFAYRLTFVRRLAAGAVWPAYRHAVARNLGLVLFGTVLYHLDGHPRNWTELRSKGWTGVLVAAFQREPFQALVHIGLTALWVLPVIAARPVVRVLFLIVSAALHLGLSKWFYFEWAWNRPVIDGGPLGFLTWTVPLLAGSLAYDTVAGPARRPILRLIAAGAATMTLGYALFCLGASGDLSRPHLAPLPFVPSDRPVNLWTMSQRTGSVSYLLFATGFALAIYALFVLACDRGHLRVGVFRTFGRNALAAYVLHEIVAGAVKPYAPADSPPWYAWSMFGVYFGLTYLFIRHLERDGVFIKM
jgi:predicted acyltransferase